MSKSDSKSKTRRLQLLNNSAQLSPKSGSLDKHRTISVGDFLIEETMLEHDIPGYTHEGFLYAVSCSGTELKKCGSAGRWSKNLVRAFYVGSLFGTASFFSANE
jgi:hypothetical protein